MTNQMIFKRRVWLNKKLLPDKSGKNICFENRVNQKDMISYKKAVPPSKKKCVTFLFEK